jgi:hypothetical protein
MLKIICVIFLFSGALIAGEDSGINYGFTPVIGIGAYPKRVYIDIKTFVFDIGVKGDPVHADFLGAGISILKPRDIIITPVNIRVDNIGMGFDYFPKTGVMTMGINFSF